MGPRVQGDTEPSINPANRKEVLGYLPQSRKEEVDQAVAAAKAAQPGWRKLTGAERGDLLYRVADRLESRLDEIAETMTKEMGKTLPEGKERPLGEWLFYAIMPEKGIIRSGM